MVHLKACCKHSKIAYTSALKGEWSGVGKIFAITVLATVCGSQWKVIPQGRTRIWCHPGGHWEPKRRNKLLIHHPDSAAWKKMRQAGLREWLSWSRTRLCGAVVPNFVSKQKLRRTAVKWNFSSRKNSWAKLPSFSLPKGAVASGSVLVVGMVYPNLRIVPELSIFPGHQIWICNCSISKLIIK